MQLLKWDRDYMPVTESLKIKVRAARVANKMEFNC